MQKSHIYNTVAMSNQFAMQKSHIYSIAVMSTLKAQTRKNRVFSSSHTSYKFKWGSIMGWTNLYGILSCLKNKFWSTVCEYW